MNKSSEGTLIISYARMYEGKNPDAIRTAFVSCGADPDEIIIDDSQRRKKESEAGPYPHPCSYEDRFHPPDHL